MLTCSLYTCVNFCGRKITLKQRPRTFFNVVLLTFNLLLLAGLDIDMIEIDLIRIECQICVTYHKLRIN